MRPVRTSAKALIIRDSKILIPKNLDEKGLWHMLPGGGQENGKTLEQALQRECVEEIGTNVEVGSLVYIREYIDSHHEFAETSADFHLIEFMFSCRVPNGYSPISGHVPDTMQVGVYWLDLTELATVRFFPKALIPYILGAPTSAPSATYLGDVN